MNKKFWNKDFLLLLQGGAVSSVGDVLYNAAISYSVLQQTGSTAFMSIVSAIPMFATLFLMPFSGSFSDKADRKSIIISMDVLRGAVMLWAGLAALQGRLNVTAIFVITLICSVAKVIFSPAVTVAFVDVIPPEQLLRGQSLHTTVRNLSSMLGEAVSGGMISLVGIPFTIIINGISFLFSAFTELFIKLPKSKPARSSHKLSPFRDVGKGIRAVMENKNLRIIIPLSVIINLLSAGTGRLILPFVLDKGLSIEHYGIVMSAGSRGVMLCTAVLAGKNFSPSARYNMLRAGVVIYRIFYFLFCISDSFILIVFFQFMRYAGNGLLNAVINSALFAAMPADKRGVISGIISAASTGACALSTVIYGFAGDVFSIKTVFIASALLPLIPWLLQCTNKNIKNLILNS